MAEMTTLEFERFVQHQIGRTVEFVQTENVHRRVWVRGTIRGVEHLPDGSVVLRGLITKSTLGHADWAELVLPLVLSVSLERESLRFQNIPDGLRFWSGDSREYFIVN
ncbi:TPA: hypothetical protein DF272_00420 [Candidatus Falkowbacteria bacterium]|nr:hypothetical protein [Candidatus Falkowbacteria bacterium]